jgi:hypothetical protein
MSMRRVEIEWLAGGETLIAVAAHQAEEIRGEAETCNQA